MRARAFRDDGGDQIAVRPVDDNRNEASCFADDVVIDFPSMASALERMRQGFFAEERQPRICTTIRLSGREAMTGATVPLDVPLRCTCPQCGGRGESWTERCTRCHGSGEELRHHPFQVTLPAGIEDGARFHFTVTLRQHSSTRVELHVLVV